MQNEKAKKFFSSKTTRSIVVIAAVLLIGLAVYLNFRWFYDPIGSLGYGDNNMDNNKNNQDNSQTTGGEENNSNAENNYFTATALNRQQSRDEAIDVLKLVTENEDASAEAKAEAAAKISKIAVDIQNETNIETLVKAKGFEDCLAVVNDDGVNIVVKTSGLLTNEVAQIREIAMQETGFSPENIKIIEKN